MSEMGRNFKIMKPSNSIRYTYKKRSSKSRKLEVHQTIIIFTKLLINRLRNKLDKYQPVTQVAFRKKFSTCENLMMRLLAEETTECNHNVCFLFVDFDKSFGSLEYWTIINNFQMHVQTIKQENCEAKYDFFNSSKKQGNK